MSQVGLLKLAANVLDQLGVPFMLTGSLATSLQGEPRLTHDIDLVVDFPVARAEDLLKAFPLPDFDLSEQAVREAIQRQGMFNLIALQEGDKIDFWMLTDDPFDQSRFQRRRPIQFQGTSLWVSSPEDTILKKLSWRKLSPGDSRHIHDALRVYELQSDRLDRAYLDSWVERLNVEEGWQQILRTSRAVN